MVMVKLDIIRSSFANGQLVCWLMMEREL